MVASSVSASAAARNQGQARGKTQGIDGIHLRHVSIEAPWLWLGNGWRDLWRIPAISLTYGLVFAVIVVGILVGVVHNDWQAVTPALGGGILLIGPMLAVGLYEASRRLESGEAIDARDVMLVGVRSPGQLALLGALLLAIYFAWVLVAVLLFSLFIGGAGMPPLEEFIPLLLFSNKGVMLLVTGTIIGALLAVTVFAVTAVSVPLLLERDIDVVTAVGTSLDAVARNPRAMALWAALIAGLMILGFVTLCVGLVIVFPLIGHATWHAFRDIVDLPSEPEITPDVLKR